MFAWRSTQDVHTHPDARPGVAHPMPTTTRPDLSAVRDFGQQEGDVAPMPDVSGGLGWTAVVIYDEPSLFVAAAQVADHPPAPMEVDAAGRAFREDHSEDVESAGAVGVQQVADSAALERLFGPPRHGPGYIEDRPQSRHHAFDASQICGERFVVEGCLDRLDQGVQRRRHGAPVCR